MSLATGARLGHCDVTALIGEDGMRQVYRATDTRLKREAAIRVLPSALEADPERVPMKPHSPALHLTIAVWLVLAVSALAHHSVEGQFDVNSRITLTGTVSAIEWINPHAYVYLDVKNEDDTVTTWALETAPIARMRRGGLTKQALAGKPGEQVTVVGMPATRQGNHSIWLIKIAYEDGKYYILHDSPVELPAIE